MAGRAVTYCPSCTARASSAREVGYASEAAEALEARIEDENLDGAKEVEELRGALERVQNLSVEISEDLDAYQDRHAS